MSEVPGHILNLEDINDSFDELENLTPESIERESFYTKLLIVKWDSIENKLYFSASPTEEGECCEDYQYVCDDQKSIMAYLQQKNERINEAVKTESDKKHILDSIEFQLRSIGKDLFKKFIPNKIAFCLKKWDTGSSLLLSSNAQWIPWELIHDGENFLGKKFLFSRIPRPSDQKEIKWEERPKRDSHKKIEKIVHVIGGKLSEKDKDNKALQEKAATLFEKLPPSIVNTRIEPSIAEFNEALSDADLIHLTCHGYLFPHQMLQISKNQYLTDNLFPDNVSELDLKRGTLVFANACNSAVPVLVLNDFVTFAWEFYQKGAEIFIGTLAEVPVSYALPFAESVYEHFFEQNNSQEIDRAINIAKESIKNSNNLFCLLYCIYGNPDSQAELPKLVEFSTQEKVFQ